MLSRVIRNSAGHWWRQWNVRFLLLFGLSVVNLLFMHGQMTMTVEYEYPFKVDAILSNVFSCLIDTTFFFLLSMLLTRGRVKGALLMTFILTALLSFCNVLYSRFFGHYLPNLAILQMGNLNDNDVMGSTLTGFRWQDLFYILWAVLFGWLYKRYDKVELKTQWLKTMGWLWGVMLAGVVAFILVLGLLHDHDLEISFVRFSPIKQQYTQAPNNMLYRSGFLRRALVCYDDFIQTNLELDESQKEAIRREYTDYKQRTTTATVEGEKNLIFIIVESYLAQTSDLVVDGKEITPFMNRLKRDSMVYYNGHMHPNIDMGESSDGQFIYMTGLLPLKSEITINIAKDKTFCGLPAMLMKSGKLKHSHIIVPTSPTFWEQDKMNPLYGIEQMYSKFDCDKSLHDYEDLNDEQVFTMASKVEAAAVQPFFSLVVTMSMHNPYNKCVEHGFTIADKRYSAEYLNYLVDCHYTDMQIDRYFDALKQLGLYENSVIVITADHDAHPIHLNVEENAVSNELPLYVINGGIDSDHAWTGPCNQLDVYTTLLDMFGIRSDWRGLGHTLLNANYQEYPIEKLQTLSDWIIRSNYFTGRCRSVR
jgi:lipoteichoic acid synthase